MTTPGFDISYVLDYFSLSEYTTTDQLDKDIAEGWREERHQQYCEARSDALA
jgi:hypothetical protein